MKSFFVVTALAFLSLTIQASQYRQVKPYASNVFTADDSKIKSCLNSLYASQIQFRKTKGYFAALPEELELTRYKVCDGLEISTHLVTDNKFKMTAKFNHRTWSIDESHNIQPQRKN